MNINSAFNGSYTDSPIWYQKFDFRQIEILRGGQPTADFDAVDNCWLYVTTMKAMNFQGDFASDPVDNFKNQYLIVFDSTSMEDAAEKCHYPELIGEPKRPELNFIFPAEHVTEFILLGGRMTPVAVDKFGVLWENTLDKVLEKMGNVSL